MRTWRRILSYVPHRGLRDCARLIVLLLLQIPTAIIKHRTTLGGYIGSFFHIMVANSITCECRAVMLHCDRI